MALKTTWRTILLGLMLLLGLGLGVAAIRGQDDASPTATPLFNVVVAPEVFLRAGPGTEYPTIGNLQRGDFLFPLNRDESGQWVMVSYFRGAYGWLRRDLGFWVQDIDALPILTPPDLTPTVPPGAETATPFFPTNTPQGNWVRSSSDVAYVRAGPGQGYLRLGQLFNGDNVIPVARNADTTWVMILWEAPAVVGATPRADKFGWLASNLVDWEADLAALPVIAEDALTPTATFTATITPSTTSTATATPSETASPTETSTATVTPSETVSPTETNTATVTPSETASPTETNTATVTPSETASPTETSTATATPSETASPTETNTATVTPSETASPTETNTATVTPSETVSPTETSTATVTPSETASPTETSTATVTPSETASPTETNTATVAPSETASPTEGEPLAEVLPTEATVEPTRTLAPLSSDGELPTLLPPTSTDDPLSVAVVPTLPTLPDDAPTTDDIPPEASQSGVPVEAFVGGALLIGLLIYVGFFLRGLVATDRYKGGFVIETCPVCGRGHLHVDVHTARPLGVPRARHTVRCDACRSVLREVGLRRWRYAIDRLENSTLYERFNGRVITDETLIGLAQNPLPRHVPPRPKAPTQPPEFVDDEPEGKP